MAVNNAGAGGMKGCNAFKLRLQRPGFFTAEQHQVVHAIGCGFETDGLQLGHLLRLGCDDQLAAAAVRYAALGGIGVHEGLALHTQPGLERALRVVNAGVYDFAVARAGAGANGVGGFQHPDFTSLQSQRTGHGQAHHPCANHHCIYAVHVLAAFCQFVTCRPDRSQS